MYLRMLYKIFTVKYNKFLIQISKFLAIWDKHYANLGFKIWWNIKQTDIYETENITVIEFLLSVAPGVAVFTASGAVDTD